MVALRKISSFACYFNSVLIFSRGGESLTTQDGLWETVGEEAPGLVVETVGDRSHP